MAGGKNISLELTADEALVLFEWLSRYNQIEDAVFEDAAEQRVLFDLESQLESLLSTPFEPDYKESVAAARDRVRDME